MTIKQNLAQITNTLRLADIDQAELEAELMLAHILNKPREFVLSYQELSLNPRQQRQLKKLVAKRLSGLALAHLTHHKAFYDIDLYVNNRVLIPRPETEHLVDAVITKVNTQTLSDRLAIIDIGTGSGCIIISLAKHLDTKISRYLAIDVSKSALAVARQNAQRIIPQLNIDFIKSDLLTKLLNRKQKTLDYLAVDQLIIVANLPYLRDNWPSTLSPRQTLELRQEPQLALLGGTDGLDLYRRLKQQLLQLKSDYPHLNITLYAEIDPDQEASFRTDFSTLGKINFHKDHSDRIRLAIVK